MKQFYSSDAKMRIKCMIFMLAVFCFAFQKTNAQAGSYAFSTSSGATLTTMTGSTPILGTGVDDGSSTVQTIPFTFTFACTSYTQFSASSNGLMGLGATAVSSGYSNSVTGSGSYPIIMPWWDDMHTCTTGKVHFLTTGSAPNRILTVEWLFGNFGESGVPYTKTVQVRLYETTNVIEIVYGANTGAVLSSGSVGIASSTSSYQSVTTSANTSSNSAANDANTTWTSGRMYTFTPGATMAFTSCTTAAVPTTSVTKCDVNKEVLGIQVVMTGSCSPMSLTQFQINMTGTTAAGIPSDVSLIHIYYTGTSSTYSATGAFNGGGTASAAGTITINGSQALSNGTNYFWIAYDINSTATTADVVDAQCTQLTVAAVTHVPTATSAAGTRSITVCPPSPGNVSSGIALWLKANAGLTTAGVNVTGWADQSTAATAVTVNGSPDYVAAGNNYNPYINFTLSNAAVTGGDYLHTADMAIQTFFLVGKMNDLTRKSTHIATYDQVTFSAPCGLCAIHGGENGTANAEYGEFTYGNANFQSAGVWRKNGDPSGVAYNTVHSGKFDIVSALGIGTGSVNSFLGGQVDNPGTGFNGRMRDWYGPVGELIVFTGAITTTQANKIESYLAIKYGITLGGNGSTTLAYTSTGGTTIWTANTGYHYDVTGIGKEVAAEALDQPKSHSINTPADLVILANSSFAAPTSITNDGDYLVVGHNNGSLASPIVGNYNHGGPSTAIGFQLSRVWRTQKTGNPAGNVIIEFNMALVNGPTGYGTNTNTNIRLLVDNDATFSNGSAGEHTYSPTAGFSATGGVIDFSVPYSDLSSIGFMTLGSVNSATAPLPVELTNFTADCQNDEVTVKWTTASEVNNNYFTVDKASDGVNFEPMGTIAGAGSTSEEHHYEMTDHQPYNGESYYRLSQTDFDGVTKTFNAVAVNCMEENAGTLNITAANINSDELSLTFSTSFTGIHEISIYDMTGNLLRKETGYFGIGNNTKAVSMQGLAEGIYLVRVLNSSGAAYKKVLIVK